MTALSVAAAGASNWGVNTSGQSVRDGIPVHGAALLPKTYARDGDGRLITGARQSAWRYVDAPNRNMVVQGQASRAYCLRLRLGWVLREESSLQGFRWASDWQDLLMCGEGDLYQRVDSELTQVYRGSGGIAPSGSGLTL